MRAVVLAMGLSGLGMVCAGVADAQLASPTAASPDITSPAGPVMPALRQIPAADVASLFTIDPETTRLAEAHVKVVGAFEVAETPDMRLVDAWSPWFLPVILKFSDGQCVSLTADYNHGALSNGRLQPVSCDRPQGHAAPRARPANPALRYIGSAWGYSAWADDKAGTTIISVPFGDTFEPLVVARMPVSTILAVNGIDTLGGNVTLVGRVDGRLTIVTLEVGY